MGQVVQEAPDFQYLLEDQEDLDYLVSLVIPESLVHLLFQVPQEGHVHPVFQEFPWVLDLLDLLVPLCVL